MSSSPLDCTSFEWTFPNLEAYKVFGNETKLSAIVDDAWAQDDLDGKGSLQHEDWQALYMQFQSDHVLGTVPYRWESNVNDYREAQLMKVTFEGLSVVMLNGNCFHRSDLSAAEKAGIAKRALGINGLLMHELGKRGKAALVQESESEWELLVPHCLLPSLVFQERVVARWRRHPQFPEAKLWCDARWPDMWAEWSQDCEHACVPSVSEDLLSEVFSSCLNTTCNSEPKSKVDVAPKQALANGSALEQTEVPGLWVLPGFVSEDIESELVAAVDQAEWKLNRAQTRRVQMYGVKHDDQYRVHAKSDATPLPLFAEKLIDGIQLILSESFPEHLTYMHRLGITKLTELFINEYDRCSDLQFHIDHIVTYEDMIVGVSLASDSVFRFRNSEFEHVVKLPRRSAYFMTGKSRTDYKHGMLEGDCKGPRRISMTFRVVAASAIKK